MSRVTTRVMVVLAIHNLRSCLIWGLSTSTIFLLQAMQISLYVSICGNKNHKKNLPNQIYSTVSECKKCKMRTVTGRNKRISKQAAATAMQYNQMYLVTKMCNIENVLFRNLWTHRDLGLLLYFFLNVLWKDGWHITRIGIRSHTWKPRFHNTKCNFQNDKQNFFHSQTGRPWYLPTLL